MAVNRTAATQGTFMLLPDILLIWHCGMADSSSFGAMQALACAEVTGKTWELSISKGATKRDFSSRAGTLHIQLKHIQTFIFGLLS